MVIICVFDDNSSLTKNLMLKCQHQSPYAGLNLRKYMHSLLESLLELVLAEIGLSKTKSTNTKKRNTNTKYRIRKSQKRAHLLNNIIQKKNKHKSRFKDNRLDNLFP